MALKFDAANGRRLAALLLDARQFFLLELFKLIGRERRLAQHFGDQPYHCRQVLARRLNADSRRRRAAADADARLQLIELVFELLACVFGGAAHQHRAGKLACCAAIHQTLFIAEAQRHRSDYRVAARLLRQQSQLDAAGA